MKNYRLVSPDKFNCCPFSLIGDEWMLISAAKQDGEINFMTASWGGMGVLWGKNVCFIFVRPSRYTYEFVEESSHVSLSFFDADYRSKLVFCGTKSGRDYDKAKECGFNISVEDSCPVFEEAKITVKARKLYASMIKPDDFVDKSCIDDVNNLHKMYVYEIEEIAVKD